MTVLLPRVLLVATSASRFGDTDVPTGAVLEELTTPYYYFQGKGYAVDVASIRGGKITWDTAYDGRTSRKVHSVQRFAFDETAQSFFAGTTSIVYANPADYSAIYIAGGHGALWDMPYNTELQRLLSESFAAGKVVAAVHHGVAALTQLQQLDPASGEPKPFLAGKQVTGTSDREEYELKLAELVPFLLESRLKQLGARYLDGPVEGKSFAVRDGKLITGRNAASSQAVAELVVEALSLGVRLVP